MRQAIACTVLLMALVLGACAPITATRGNLVEPERLARIEVGRSTDEDVVDILGSPTVTGTFDDNRWYYVGQVTEQRAFFRPEIASQQIIAIAFDTDGVVAAVDRISEEEAREVGMVNRTTPTGGRELGFFEQIFGNLGGL